MEVHMLNFFIPLLITTSQSIYGWNAMYASGRVPEMQESAFSRLEKIAAEKCSGHETEFVNPPVYDHAYTGAHYVEHAYAFISCRKKR